MEEPKLEYIHRRLLEGLRRIYAQQRNDAQRQVYSDTRGHGRTGALMDALSHPRLRVWKGALGNHAVMEYPIYIRFLDLRKRGLYKPVKLYNRQIWQSLYRDLFPSIRYEYRREVREWIRDMLHDIANQLTDK